MPTAESEDVCPFLHAPKKEEQKAAWNKALLACSGGQEYTIGSRRLRRADLPEIRKTLEWLDSQPTVEDVQSGRAQPCFTQLLTSRGSPGGY